MWKKVDGRWCDAYVEGGKWVYKPVTFAAVYEYEEDGDRLCYDVCADDEGVVASFMDKADALEYVSANQFHYEAYPDQEDDWSDPVNRLMNAAGDGDCIGVWYGYWAFSGEE